MSLIPLSRRAGSSLIVRAYLRRGLQLRLPKEEPTSVLQFMGGGSHGYHYRRYISPSKPLFVRGEKADESTIATNKKYLSESLGFNEDQLAKLRTSPISILTLENGVLEERANWIKERLNLEKKSDIQKITQKQTEILSLLPDTNLAPKLDYLQKRLRLNEKSLRKLVLGAPSVLSLSVEDNIEPKLDHLQKKLELSDSALSKMVQRYPAILTYSIPDNLEPKLAWFQHRLDLDNAALSKMIQLLPAIFSYSISDNLEPKLGWLKQRLSLSDEELSNLVQKMPPLLGCSVDENIEPTLNFHIEALGDEGEALALLVRGPRLFGSSLEKRLKPRLKEALDAGLIIDKKCLQRIGLYTEKRWQSSLVSQSKKLTSRSTF